MDLKPINKEGALLYLKLREDKCNRYDAVRCAARVRCRSDISKQTEGLVNNKYDLRYPTKPVDRNLRTIKNGWVRGNLSLTLGSDYDPYIEEKESEFSNLHKIDSHLTKFLNKKTKKFKAVVANFREFFSEETTKRLSDLKGAELLKEIHTIRNQITNPTQYNSILQIPLGSLANSLNQIPQNNLAANEDDMTPLNIKLSSITKTLTFNDLNAMNELDSAGLPNVSKGKLSSIKKDKSSFKNPKTRPWKDDAEVSKAQDVYLNEQEIAEDLRQLKKMYLEQAKTLSNSNMYREASKLLNVEYGSCRR